MQNSTMITAQHKYYDDVTTVSSPNRILRDGPGISATSSSTQAVGNPAIAP